MSKGNGWRTSNNEGNTGIEFDLDEQFDRPPSADAPVNAAAQDSTGVKTGRTRIGFGVSGTHGVSRKIGFGQANL